MLITTRAQERRGLGALKATLLVASDSTVIVATRGFHVSVTGDVVVKFAEGDDDVDLGTLPIGMYPYSIIKFKAASTATVYGLY
jgi:hypothetical protein